MNRVSKSVLAAVISVAALASLTACSDGSPVNTSGPSIVIGIKTDQPGLSYKSGNTYSGFDIDVARYVADQLGYSSSQIVWKEVTSSDREKVLEDGEVDMVVASYSITAERKQSVEFAGPYLFVGQDLLVRESDASITSVSSLEGKKLCSVTGSTSSQAFALTADTGLGSTESDNTVQLVEESGYSQCVTALLSGTVDAVVSDDLILAGLSKVKGDGQLKLIDGSFSQQSYGIGVGKGDKELVRTINLALEKYVSSGQWKKDVTAATKGLDWQLNSQLDSQWNPPTEFKAQESTEGFAG